MNTRPQVRGSGGTCRYNDLTLNEEQFTHAEAMFARVAALGFHVCFWITPFVNRKNVVDMHGIQPWPSKNFGPAATAGHLVKEQRTGRPQARRPTRPATCLQSGTVPV